jgi:hypothetical protein
MPLISQFAVRLLSALPEMIDCTAVSELIPVRWTIRLHAKLEGDTLLGVTFEIEPWLPPTLVASSTRQVLRMMLRRTSSVWCR